MKLHRYINLHLNINRKIFFAGILSCALALPWGVCGAKPMRLTLAESIGMALSSDESIETSEAQREAADQALRAARRSTGPTVAWESQAYRIGGRDYESANDSHDAYGDPHEGSVSPLYYSEGSGVFLGSPITVGSYAYHNTFANSWSLTVPLYTGGRLEGQIDASRYRLNSADLATENTRQTVRYQAAEAYANLIHQENLAQVAKDAVDQGNTQLELIRAQFEEGAVAEADVLMMSVNVANYKQHLVSAKAAVAVAKATLASVVGLPQDTDVEPSDVFSYEAYGKDLPSCERYALEHRPDGIAAEYEIKAAEAQKDAAKSGYRPSVTAVGSKSIESNAAFRSERRNYWQAGVNISWSVFDNGVTRANVKQADATVKAYEAEARRVKKAIQLETRTAYLEMKAAEQNIAETSAAVRQAQDSYFIARVRYEEGVDGLLGVTDAQEKLTQARSNYLTALYQYNLYRARLEKAMGVPVGFDPLRYREAEQEGASPRRAVDIASGVSEDGKNEERHERDEEQ